MRYGRTTGDETMSTVRRSVVHLLAVVVLLLAIPVGAARADKIFLKDGRSFEGQVVREVNGLVWFKVGKISEPVLFRPSEIDRIDRTAAPEPEPDARAEQDRPKRDSARHSGAPRAAIITLGEGGDKDMVGLYMTADSLRKTIPLLEKENVDVVVLRINSGGGALLEIQKLSDVIQNELKPRFRTVGWIESAISAAAMSAHCLEEIYFTPQGNYGACTGWSGQLVAVKGRELEEVLYMMEKISARGHHDPAIMHAMQHSRYPLSCTIEADGTVTWYQDETSGDILVNPKGRILTFDAPEALKYGFSQGTAATYEELGHLMGYEELDWVGEFGPTDIYPVCDAEKYMRQFRNQVHEDEQRVREYIFKFRSAVETAQGTPREDRGKFVNLARKALNQIVRAVDNNPNFPLFELNMRPDLFPEWVEQQKQLLRDLMK